MAKKKEEQETAKVVCVDEFCFECGGTGFAPEDYRLYCYPCGGSGESTEDNQPEGK